MNTTNYPASLGVDYVQNADRLTTFFRIFTIIPIAIIFGLLVGSFYNQNNTDNSHLDWLHGGILMAPTLLMILFVQKYPRWWFDWNLALLRFSMRIFSYLLLLTHEYPSTDEEQSVHIEIPYPDVKKDLNRWLPLVKWFLAIPHFIVLALLYVGVVFCTIIAWFAILFTGSYPKGMFDFVVGVMRWTIRVEAYMLLLTTDEYPPFSLN